MSVVTSLPAAVQDVVWQAWGEGESLRRIADRAGVPSHHVRRYLLRHGGVRPALPRRSPRHLSPGEREEISRGIAAGLSARAIAEGLGRSASTVSREIARNGGRDAYRATVADERARVEARRSRVPRLASDERLRAVVLSRLELDWSPQQIAARLRREHPHEPGMWVSHETIYRAVYLPASRNLPKSTYQRLRSGRTMRRPRLVKRSHGRGHLRDMVSIHHRPATVTDRLEPGHWEGDLVMGKRPSAVATLVERTTRYLKIVPLPDGIKAKDVSIAVARALFNVPPGMCKSLTWDRGREMADHAFLSALIDAPVYFCDPRSPWQRGTNENTNRLLRQYLPRRTNMNATSNDELERIERLLNERPRQVLAWAAPTERFLETAAAARELRRSMSRSDAGVRAVAEE
ncbi:IS30 family transposase [Cellulosimicrobium sp. TH-20]|uniref:IS30 family transposase n=1 Tax=Cellulosimicrobium sp. TH-20 TaxID=1980001 RepID=UPI0011A23325|nr:IS30 family transposase [Cellulosimicrobium sp. TH-20]